MTTAPAVTAPPRRGRALAAACAGLALAALLLWVATTLTWYRVTVPGRAPVEFDGSHAAPSMAGVALLALATVAALVAMSGIARRLLGVLVAVVGVLEGLDGVRGLLGTPFDRDGPLPVTPTGVAAEALRHQPTELTGAPLLAVAGGVLLLVVGLFVVLREPRLPRFGARYAAAGKSRPETDPDRAAWQDLDAGRDPTADATADPTADTAVDRGDDPASGTRFGPD
ncbi:Trp biosynthesis-associated membrane protein [Pseudonocardia sp. GCM10023141]|uniref:Trp biosynthesis-associated membrane protein n=1 Tax=Pseudonocardia sp. GCM10023141 TaxID=3252653 RepID=UPI003613A823